MTLKGHFDGKQIVLDDPPPPGLAVNARVKTLVENGHPSTNGPHATGPTRAFDAILGMAENVGLPPDFAAQHDYYTKGLPKR